MRVVGPFAAGSATDAVIERWDFDHQAAAFRRVEEEVVAEAARRVPAVIATGGGSTSKLMAFAF